MVASGPIVGYAQAGFVANARPVVELSVMSAMLVPIDQGKPIVLDKPIVLVGRHPDCDAVILHSRKISRKHCAVALVNNSFVVRDLGSMNGVWVNGTRVETQSRINFGDELMIGDVRYTLEADKPVAGKVKPSVEKAATPVSSGKPNSLEAPAARKKALVTPPQSELSMEFPVPIDDVDEDGFSVPPPDKKEAGRDTDGGEDQFIPLKQE